MLDVNLNVTAKILMLKIIPTQHMAKIWTSFDHPIGCQKRGRVLDNWYTSGSPFGRWFRSNQLLKDIVRIEFCLKIVHSWASQRCILALLQIS